MKHLLIAMVCVLFPSLTMGQYASPKECPTWVKKSFFADRPNSYTEVVSATGYSEENARDNAAQVIVKRRSIATGQRANISVENGRIKVGGSDDLTVKARILDEYNERMAPGEYRSHLLVQTAKNPELPFEPVTITDRYPFSARAFVPGMAQLHKGSTTKGVLFIVGEVAAIGGIVAFEGLRASNQSKINSTHNATKRQHYIDNADKMQNVRNGFIAGAVAIYAWNVIDGIVAKGKKHVVVGNAEMNFAPYASLESSGVMMNMRF